MRWSRLQKSNDQPSRQWRPSLVIRGPLTPLHFLCSCFLSEQLPYDFPLSTLMRSVRSLQSGQPFSTLSSVTEFSISFSCSYRTRPPALSTDGSLHRSHLPIDIVMLRTLLLKRPAGSARKLSHPIITPGVPWPAEGETELRRQRVSTGSRVAHRLMDHRKFLRTTAKAVAGDTAGTAIRAATGTTAMGRGLSRYALRRVVAPGILNVDRMRRPTRRLFKHHLYSLG